MGFPKAVNKKKNESVAWQERERAYLTELCNDWESSVSASQRANTILISVQNGSIILLYDFQGNTNTVQALPTIIEGLKNQGYTFVTVNELFEAKGVNPNQEYKIWTNVN